MPTHKFFGFAIFIGACATVTLGVAEYAPGVATPEIGYSYGQRMAVAVTITTWATAILTLMTFLRKPVHAISKCCIHIMKRADCQLTS